MDNALTVKAGLSYKVLHGVDPIDFYRRLHVNVHCR